MRIIKLGAIDSTNLFLRHLSAKESIDDYTTVVADHQTNGRGQMGTQWTSQESKNLMVSVFKDVSFLNIEHNFYISIVVSLSILRALESLHIKNLKVKWPNDILADQKKLAGVLIENVIKQKQLQASIIGFGLNVNQTVFIDLPKASSLLLQSGRVFDLDEVLHEILNQLKLHFSLLENGKQNQLKSDYEAHLFRKDRPSTFKNAENELFSGIILGITDSGNLRVQMDETAIREFDLKEITLLY